jgi:hypothetical protein
MHAWGRSAGRIVLLALTVWGLAMVAPDLYRLARPLGSFGFYADNAGLITDVRGPFTAEADSPAWRAGLRPGDRLDLRRMRCIPLRTLRCASAQAALGGLRLVGVGRPGEFVLAASPAAPARVVDLVARERPFSWWKLAVLPLDQLAAIAVILAAGWLVWTRPGGMTWGFFLFVIWFNPGQSDEYYAILQYWPAALLAQELAGALAQGAGMAGFLLFALRFPQDRSGPRWRPLQRALPALAGALAVLLALSFANLFGHPTEMITRAGILSGFLVAGGAFAILLARRGEQSPADYQRLRWVIWGCLIGLPALVLADVGEGTSLLAGVLGGVSPPEAVWGLLRLVGGVLCLFVFEAVRRPHVVNVAVPLRRVTILGLLLSLPALLLHQQIDRLREGLDQWLDLPHWIWLPIGALALFLISRLHELAVRLVDRSLHRPVAQAGRDLGEAIVRARDIATVEDRLANGAAKALGLASAGVFRHDDGVFTRGACSDGWDDQAAATLDPADPLLKNVAARRPFNLDPAAAERDRLPAGPARPVLGVPVADRFDCFALALYGAHVSGADLNRDERGMLADLADLAAAAWRKLEHEGLKRRVADLEQTLATLTAKAPP